jgi:hypothetical protein
VGEGCPGKKPFPKKLPREGLELSFSVIADTIQEVKKSSLLELMYFQLLARLDDILGRPARMLLNS